MVDGVKHHYSDTPAPKTFGNVTPLDPQLFSRISDSADELLKGERSGKYSPIEVAQWLEDLAARASGSSNLDVRIQAGLGRFFAAKFRAGVLYELHQRTHDRAALEESLRAYRAARAAWAQIADRAKGVYVADLTVGEQPWLRGHWTDRLAAIDEDIAALEKKLASASYSEHPRIQAAITEALGKPQRPQTAVRHMPPAHFTPKQALILKATADARSGRLYYRHVTQAERWESAELRDGAATIPAAYTDSPYPLQYYFEFHLAADKAFLYPGFAADLANQPYFVLRRSV
jgi:hypothetical protein